MGSQKLPFFITNSSGLLHTTIIAAEQKWLINQGYDLTKLRFLPSKEQIILMYNRDKDIWPILAPPI